MAALEANDAEKAAAVCAEDVAIELPGGDRQLEGREGAKQLIRMAPPFVRVVREEAVMGTTVILRGLTRSPGHFANYTTWTSETDGVLFPHFTFAWSPPNWTLPREPARFLSRPRGRPLAAPPPRPR